jgi:hypothetical protein
MGDITPDFSADRVYGVMRYRAFKEQIQKVVAASDTPEDLAYMADFRCDGTNDDAEVQAAVDALPDGGGEVLLLQGIYRFAASTPVLVDDNVTIAGQGSNTVIANASNVTAFRNRNYASGTNTGLTFRNFRLGEDGVGVVASFGIRLTGTYDSLIESVTTPYTPGSGKWISVVQLESCRRVIVSRCQMHSTSATVRLEINTGGNGSRNCTVVNCVLSGNNGIQDDSTSSHNMFVNNFIPYAAGIGIRSEGGFNLVQGNIIEGAQEVGISIDGNHVTCVDNIVRAFDAYGEHGIALTYVSGTEAADCIVQGNQIYGAVYFGIWVNGAVRCMVKDNRIAPQVDGIRIDSPGDVIDSIFSGNFISGENRYENNFNPAEAGGDAIRIENSANTWGNTFTHNVVREAQSRPAAEADSWDTGIDQEESPGYSYSNQTTQTVARFRSGIHFEGSSPHDNLVVDNDFRGATDQIWNEGSDILTVWPDTPNPTNDQYIWGTTFHVYYTTLRAEFVQDPELTPDLYSVTVTFPQAGLSSGTFSPSLLSVTPSFGTAILADTINGAKINIIPSFKKATLASWYPVGQVLVPGVFSVSPSFPTATIVSA